MMASFDVAGPVLCMAQLKEWVWVGMNKNICALRISVCSLSPLSSSIQEKY